jgi:hypothetical protein
MALVANILHPGDRQPPSGWQAVDTHLGAISHGLVSPLREYLAAQDIQALVVASSARIVVFPESVVPRWTMSTGLFWKPTIDTLRQNGKVVVIGALIPESLPLSNTDIHAAIELLERRMKRSRSPAARRNPTPTGTWLLFEGPNPVSSSSGCPCRFRCGNRFRVEALRSTWGGRQCWR